MDFILDQEQYFNSGNKPRVLKVAYFNVPKRGDRKLYISRNPQWMFTRNIITTEPGKYITPESASLSNMFNLGLNKTVNFDVKYFGPLPNFFVYYMPWSKTAPDSLLITTDGEQLYASRVDLENDYSIAKWDIENNPLIKLLSDGIAPNEAHKLIML